MNFIKTFKGGFNMTNLCNYCKKAEICHVLKEISIKVSSVAKDLKINYGVTTNFFISKCPDFVFGNQEKQVEHICLSCAKSVSCKLWDQVCNIDEDFIRTAFNYDTDIQEVCSTVSRCKLYKPKNK